MLFRSHELEPDLAARRLVAVLGDDEGVAIEPVAARRLEHAALALQSRQLLRHDLLHDVKGVLTRSAVLPGTLKLEISEALVMDNPEFATQMLERLHELGAGICLQGFGTGHSSLSQLQRLKIDMIKIDRLMTRPNAQGTRPVILRSLISLAHDLNVQVVADGTESEADTVELGQMGCEYAQGNAFGNPITMSEARRLVGARSEEHTSELQSH